MNWYIASFLYFLGALFLQAILARFNILSNSIVRCAVSAILLGIGLFLHLLILRFDMTDYVAAILLFGLLIELYVFLFTLSLGSISFKILSLLRETPHSEEEIKSKYAPRNMVEQRYKRLLDGEFISIDGGRIALTAKGRQVLRLVDLTRTALHTRASLKS